MANKAQKEFEKVHQRVGMPTAIKSISIRLGSWNIVDLLLETKLVSSRSQAKRLLVQKAVEINNKKMLGHNDIKILGGEVIRVGKNKWLKLV